MATKTLHPAVRAHYRKIGKKGGNARAEALTQDQIEAIARKAGKASGRARKRKARNGRQAA